MPDIILYTDGGCRGNPGGIGAWAFVLVDPTANACLERAAAVDDTTNNRMEMMAAIEGLKALKKENIDLLIHSDSQYLIKCCTEWMAGWKRKGWSKKGGELKNVDLLQELDRLLAKQPRARWEWVRGHSGNRGNERVDELANQAMDRFRRGTTDLHEWRGKWQG